MSFCGNSQVAGFVLVLLPAALGGALWEGFGLPLGWLMGAALVTGVFSLADVSVRVPKPLNIGALAALGASVGLAITPDVAAALVLWAPVMVLGAALGLLAAVVVSPALARHGRMSRSTAFFALLPGGVIEMANVGDRHGADRTVVAMLHAVRVGLVVAIVPLGLHALADGAPPDVKASDTLPPLQLAMAIGLGLLGGGIASNAGLAAAWLLGALIIVGLVAATGVLSGRMPDALLAPVQIVVGMALGARFKRAQIAAVPRAVAAGLPAILAIMGAMALAAAAAHLALPIPLSTLILCLSIGGMAEMVLTAKALGQGVALVAAFQAVRAVMVNALAGPLWRRIAPSAADFTDNPKG